MQIRPTSNLGQAQGVVFQETRSTSPVQPQAQVPVDQVELSFEAQQIARAGDGIRTDRVATIRAQIASGVYETPAKLDAAVTRMLDELA